MPPILELMGLPRRPLPVLLRFSVSAEQTQGATWLNLSGHRPPPDCWDLGWVFAKSRKQIWAFPTPRLISFTEEKAPQGTLQQVLALSCEQEPKQDFQN